MNTKQIAIAIVVIIAVLLAVVVAAKSCSTAAPEEGAGEGIAREVATPEADTDPKKPSNQGGA